MVNISAKPATKRCAKACGTVKVGTEVIKLIKDNQCKKGDVLTVAQIAGIMAAKITPNLIPLCHNINLSSINVQLTIDEVNSAIRVESTVECCEKTGAEMEALMAVTISALTVYDMCKAVSRTMVITNVAILDKSGGSNSV